MMRYIFIFLFLLFSASMKAPEDNSLIIPAGVRIDPFKPLKYGIGMVECNLDTMAYNTKERATGYFQITPIRLKDYNQRTGSNLQLSEMFDYAKAETVFMYYTFRFGVYRIDDAILDWNCQSRKYLNKVKKHLTN